MKLISRLIKYIKYWLTEAEDYSEMFVLVINFMNVAKSKLYNYGGTFIINFV